jgi:hypothetical protein
MALAGLGLANSIWNGSCRSEEQAGVNYWNAGKFYGVGSCQECHTQPTALRKDSLDFVYLAEYAIWRVQDKHSLAYLALEGKRGQQMAKILGFQVSEDSRCLNCHAMNYPKERQGEKFSLRDGVSCDGCHGPAEGWYGEHTQRASWRKQTPEYKEGKGMRDVRNPTKKAAMCLACHVGNAAEGKVISHSMYAAGHPPLPIIDVALFSKNLPQHWRDLKDVPYLRESKAETQKLYHYDPEEKELTKNSVLGSLVALQESMGFLAERANVELKGNAKTRWPELFNGSEAGDDLPRLVRSHWPELAMTHFDCLACHHDLKSESWRQERGCSGFPGRPQVRPWPGTLATAVIFEDKTSAESASEKLRSQLQELRLACGSRPFGEPAKIQRAAETVKTWCTHQAEQLQKVKITRARALRLLKGLCESVDPYPDYETARALASAVLVVCLDAGLDKDPALGRALAEIDAEFELRASSGRQYRQQVIIAEVKRLAQKETMAGVEGLATDMWRTLKPSDLFGVLQKNQLLDTLRGSIDNAELREALLKNDLEKLQTANEKEMNESLEKLNSYSPKVFKEKLRNFGKLIAQVHVE